MNISIKRTVYTYYITLNIVISKISVKSNNLAIKGLQLYIIGKIKIVQYFCVYDVIC